MKNIFYAAFLFSLLAGCSNLTTQALVETSKPTQDGRTVDVIVDDNLLAKQIKQEILQSDPGFELAHLNVTSHNGKILVVGQISSQELKQKVSDIALANKSAKTIHNELVVGDNIAMVARANDAWISMKVRSKFIATKEFPSQQVEVTTQNGIVYLMGIVDQPTSNQAGKLAQQVKGVQKVITLFDYTPTDSQ